MLGKVSNHNEAETNEDAVRTGHTSIEEIMVTIRVAMEDGVKTKPTYISVFQPIL